MNADDKREVITLNLLKIVEGNSTVSQRAVAKKLGIALSMANLYLKRCVQKGLLKIEQAPANRYLYYLTPNGLSEKARLAGKYMQSLFKEYRMAKLSLARIYTECKNYNQKQVTLFGVSDLTELAVLWSQHYGITVEQVFSPAFESPEYLGKTVVSSIDEVNEGAVIILTCLSDFDFYLSSARAVTTSNKIFTPSILER